MPGFDGTGPRGMGPLTGGGRGFCGPRGMGRMYGFGRRFGFGRGYRFGMAMPYAGPVPYGYVGVPVGGVPGAYPYAPQMTREQELGFLKEQAEAIKGELGEIETRIEELEQK